MSFPFNITNPGIYITGLLTSAEASFVTGLVNQTYSTGDILYYNGTEFVRLPAGTNGHVLTLVAGIPDWEPGGGGGGGSGITRTVVVTSGNVSAGASASTDYVYLIAGAHTVTLPTAVGNTNLYTIKNNHSASVSLATTSSQTVDGVTSPTIRPEQSLQIISNGTNWNVV